MTSRPLAAFALLLLFSNRVSASDHSVDGDRLAECYATYDALVSLGEGGKLSAAETDGYKARRAEAEAKALAQYRTEGLDEDNAHGQLEGRAEYMREELRDLHAGTGIYTAEEMKGMASACDRDVNP